MRRQTLESGDSNKLELNSTGKLIRFRKQNKFKEEFISIQQTRKEIDKKSSKPRRSKILNSCSVKMQTCHESGDSNKLELNSTEINQNSEKRRTNLKKFISISRYVRK
ncbi:hypothetical protein AVEN_93001-1 [Araneus ventricosus]|uniref:Uncharacterized protein n=1 Tax=Araneus ventricosus TaxID=182803 RepID=A0A4Y2MD32_ARAVE|nr:hypothetical protein AVEN_93001-1 [Araneus ventricosus]